MSFSSLGGLYSTSRGRVQPSQRDRTPGFMASDRKSVELTGCNPTIALSPKRKNTNPVIRSLFKRDRFSAQTDGVSLRSSGAPSEVALHVLQQ